MSADVVTELLNTLIVPAGAASKGQVLNRLAGGCARLSGGCHTSIILREPGQAPALQGVSSPQAEVAWDIEHRHGQGPTWDALQAEHLGLRHRPGG